MDKGVLVLKRILDRLDAMSREEYEDLYARTLRQRDASEEILMVKPEFTKELTNE
jgi:hypothetical protein